MVLTQLQKSANFYLKLSYTDSTIKMVFHADIIYWIDSKLFLLIEVWWISHI